MVIVMLGKVPEYPQSIYQGISRLYTRVLPDYIPGYPPDYVPGYPQSGYKPGWPPDYVSIPGYPLPVEFIPRYPSEYVPGYPPSIYPGTQELYPGTSRVHTLLSTPLKCIHLTSQVRSATLQGAPTSWSKLNDGNSLPHECRLH